MVTLKKIKYFLIYNVKNGIMIKNKQLSVFLYQMR